MSKVLDTLEAKGIKPEWVTRMTERDGGSGRRWVKIYHYKSGSERDFKEHVMDEILVRQYDIEDAITEMNRGSARVTNFARKKKNISRPIEITKTRRKIDWKE